MVSLFNTILYQPIYNLLIAAYNLIPGHDIGLAIIFITIIVKVILLPFSRSALRSQKAMQELQPKLDEIKSKCGNNKEMLAKETMRLYRENKVNPLSSCLPLLIQLPILIAVYRAFQVGLSSEHFELLYPFVSDPGHINPLAFGFLDMSKASVALAVLSGLAQYAQTEMLIAKKPKPPVAGSKDEAMLASMNKSMQYFMPFMTIIIGMSLPAGLTFYWFLTTVLTIIQQKFIFQKKPTSMATAEIKSTENNQTSQKVEIEVIPPPKDKIS